MPRQTGEIYTLGHGREIRLTHANDGIYDRCAVSTPQPLEVDTGGPLPVQGWVLPPVAYVPGKKYPAILTIHGGPRLSYGSVFFHEMILRSVLQPPGKRGPWK